MKQSDNFLKIAAGATGNGVISAAQQHKKFAIGVDSDQDYMAKGYVLTSMMKRLDKAVIREISLIMEGKFQPGVHLYGLKEKGVSLSPMKYTNHLIPKEVLNQLNKLEKAIIDGQIQVTNYLNTLSK